MQIDRKKKDSNKYRVEKEVESKEQKESKVKMLDHQKGIERDKHMK